jgi:integrase/recombinase XerD
MTPLREAFIRELVLRGTAPRTQESYVAGVYHLARHYHVPPDAVTEAQLREYLLYLIQQRQLAPSSVNLAVCALRAFYQWVLHRDLAVLREALPRMIRQIHRPRVYSPQEIERLRTVGRRRGSPGLS